MRTLERGAVYIGDSIIGFRCEICDKVVSSMLGDICNKCRDGGWKHQELLRTIKSERSENSKSMLGTY
jgi:hypothetical protein